MAIMLLLLKSNGSVRSQPLSLISVLKQCAHLLPVVVINTTSQSNLGRKGFIWLTLPGNSPPMKSGQEPGAEATEDCCFLAWSLVYAGFLIPAQTHLPRDGSTNSGLGYLT